MYNGHLQRYILIQDVINKDVLLYRLLSLRVNPALKFNLTETVFEIIFIQICHAVSVAMFIYQIDITSDTIAFKMSQLTKKANSGKKNPKVCKQIAKKKAQTYTTKGLQLPYS